MKIKFKNNTEIEYINAVETEEYWNGSSRRTLTFECAPGVISVDELNTILLNEANISELILTNEEIAIENIYNGYVLKIRVGIENRLISKETPESPAVYEDRLIFKLGKRTYIEEQLKRLGL